MTKGGLELIRRLRHDGLIADKARLDHIVARTFDKQNGSHDPNPGRSRGSAKHHRALGQEPNQGSFFRGTPRSPPSILIRVVCIVARHK